MSDDHKSTEVDKMDHEEVILPGFRFHPTDEELVGFYLKKKIEHRVLPIELIKQVDIYKYDPWDLPNLAPSGEKEWYFYCPRDRKYKNSARPNRVTGAGFWKATGTDRPIYSSSSNDAKCIGLKKSLVFYRGRAAKGIKTDWMMHEFRLPPSLSDQPESNRRIQDKILTPNDAWAICRIFKKTNTIAQRAISHSWASSQIRTNSNQFSYENISCMSTTDHHLSYTIKPSSINSTFSGLDDHTLSYRPVNQILCKSSPFTLPYIDTTNRFMFPSSDNPELRVFDNANKNCSEGLGFEGEHQPLHHTYVMNHYCDNELENVHTTGFPSSLPTAAVGVADEWKLNMAWDSPPCPSESTTYSTNKCHT